MMKYAVMQCIALSWFPDPSNTSSSLTFESEVMFDELEQGLQPVLWHYLSVIDYLSVAYAVYTICSSSRPTSFSLSFESEVMFDNELKNLNKVYNYCYVIISQLLIILCNCTGCRVVQLGWLIGYVHTEVK